MKNNLKKLLISYLLISSLFIGIKIYASTIPLAPAVFDTSLSTAISTTDSSMTLAGGKLISGASLSGYTCFTVDVGNPNMEFICGTASGTAITSLVRGIDPLDGKTSVTALIFSHRRGADVKITDFPAFSIVRNIANGTDTFPNIISYGSAPTFTSGNQIVTKNYVDNEFRASYFQTITNAPTITPNCDFYKQIDITAIAQHFTIANPSCSPSNFQILIIRILDAGTGEAITWGNQYVAFPTSGNNLPTTTIANKYMILGFIYNSANPGSWQLVSVVNQ